MQRLLKRISLFWILFILICLFLQPQISVNAQATQFASCTEISGIPADECDVLVALYHDTAGESWTNHTNWLDTNTPADWYGVTVADGHVTKLILSTNNLDGSLPTTLNDLIDLSDFDVSVNELTGSIPDLSGLSSLTTLYLNDNHFSGTVPYSLGNLSALIELVLNENQLTGSIPPELGNLSNLQELILSDNQLTGEIPDTLGNLSNLRWLILYQNQLSGSIPPSLGNLTQLTHLQLSFNRLTGSIPVELGNLSNLSLLNLSNNQLSGGIPDSFEGLTNLTMVYLDNNQLTGSIPDHLENLQLLTRLSLSNNQLSGEIPDTLGNLANLEWLLLNQNQLSGSIPSSLGNLSKLTRLELAHNLIIGSIPTEIGNLSLLYSLNLSSNQLDGIIPTSLGGLTNLTMIYLGNNLLTGSIPAELGNLTQLTQLSLSNNQLDGSIPLSFGNLANLEWLLLGQNQLSNSIPTALGNLVKLTRLELAHNLLTGSIPTEIGQLVNLTNLDLSSNRLSGSIPVSLGNLTQLVQLDLSMNYASIGGITYGLSGDIPSVLGNLVNLTSLNLSDNRLTGVIPPAFGQLINLTEFHLSNNQLTGGIPELGNLSLLTQLTLSGNHLSQAIPPSLGNLTNLTYLDLSRNQLNGSIPPELGNLQGLTFLFLSDNQLSGGIPPELGNLSDLLRLSLSNNQLAGELPDSLGGLSNLEYILVAGNAQLTNAIPLSFINLGNLYRFNFNGTTICEPLDRDFFAWKATVDSWLGTGQICGYSGGIPINGKITTSNGSALADVVISAVGPSGTLTANSQSDGNYQFLLQQPGTYQLTPTKTGYLFYPPTLTVQVFRGRNNQNFRGRVTTCYSPSNPNGQACVNQPSAPFLQLPFHLNGANSIDQILQDEDLGGLITSWFNHKASSDSSLSSIELYDGETYTSSLTTSLINGVACFNRHCASNLMGIGIKPPSGSTTTNVYPAAAGTISEICSSGNCGRDTSLGRYVVIQHASRLYATLYAHLASIPSGLTTGRTVDVNTLIGTVGGSGGKPLKENYWPKQLYFAVFFNGSQANPWTPNVAEAVDPFGWRPYDEHADEWKMPSVPLWSNLHAAVSEAPDTDGTLLSSGNVTITVPPESLSEGQILTLANSSLGTQLNSSLRSIEDSFHIKIFDSVNNWSIKNPQKAFEVQVDYSQVNLSHLDAAKIALYGLVSQTWTPVTTILADQTATASISASRKYTLAAPLICPLDTQEPYDDGPDLYKREFYWGGNEVIDRIFDSPSDQDWVALDMIGGVTYIFTTQHSGDIDSILTLFNGNGSTQLAISNPTGTNTAQLEWKATANGRYYLRISQAVGSAPTCEPYQVIQENTEKYIYLPMVSK